MGDVFSYLMVSCRHPSLISSYRRNLNKQKTYNSPPATERHVGFYTPFLTHTALRNQIIQIGACIRETGYVRLVCFLCMQDGCLETGRPNFKR